MNNSAPREQPVIITPSAGNTRFPDVTRLNNGIPVYLIGNGTVDMLRVEFVFNAGQIMEQTHLSAGVTNAMLTEGTNLHDAITLNDLIDSTGAVFTHTADKDAASLMTVTLSRKLDEVMALAEEVLFHPSFPENEYRMLIDRRIQAFLISRQKTSTIARERFYHALCGDNNPYGRLTTQEDFRRLTIEDLFEFHSRCYRPDNMYLTVAGRDPEQALPTLARYFGNNSFTWHKPERPVLNFKTTSPGRYFTEVSNSVQSTLRVGWRGITRDHPDYHGLQVASMILGGYFGSRLMRSIREKKGYTYGIQSIAGSFHNLGFITIVTEVANNYREDTLREIRNEILELCRNKVHEQELAVVRNHIMGETARMFDGPFATAETIRSIIDYDADPDYYTKFVKTVETITPDTIKELFNKYFDTDNAIEIIAGAK